MNHIIINKQISLSKFLVVDKSGQNYVLEFFPGLIEFNTTNALEAMQNSKRQNDSDYYVTKYDFKSITKIYLRKYNHISEISHLFPATSKSVRETYLKYKQRIFPLRQDWIKGLIDGTRETELVIYRDSNMVLSPDPKWPVPKKMHNFYYLAMFSNYDLRSIRDLTGKDLPWLKSIKQIILKQIKKNLKNKFNEELKESELALFFHYQPQYWQLHLHISHTNSFRHCNNHFLENVISNLEIDSKYYQKTTLCYVD